MARKRKETPICSVLFTYVGTDADFDNFLKTVIHDYLMIGDFPLNETEKTIEKVESTVA